MTLTLQMTMNSVAGSSNGKKVGDGFFFHGLSQGSRVRLSSQVMRERVTFTTYLKRNKELLPQ